MKGTLKNDLNERDANVIRQFLEWAGRQQLITPAVAVAMDIEDTAIHQRMAPVVQLDAQSVDVDQQGAWMDIDSLRAIQQPDPNYVTGTSETQNALLFPIVEHQMEEETAVDENLNDIDTEVKMCDALELLDSQPAAYLLLLEKKLCGFIRVANHWRSVWADKDKTHDINNANNGDYVKFNQVGLKFS
jgi:hypothetical protein